MWADYLHERECDLYNISLKSFCFFLILKKFILRGLIFSYFHKKQLLIRYCSCIAFDTITNDLVKTGTSKMSVKQKASATYVL